MMSLEQSTCTACEKPCDGIWADMGIGPYEFWGQKCVDTDNQFVSECCEEPMLGPNGEDIDSPLYDPDMEDER